MRTRISIGVALIIAVAAIATITAGSLMPTRQSALVLLTRPTIIAGAIASGQVLFVHDHEKMANGEPCTTVYQSQAGEQGKKLVEFTCRPDQSSRAEHFTARCARGISAPDVLVEYQFMGDTETHGVPWRP
jgi:hypothetical protein